MATFWEVYEKAFPKIREAMLAEVPLIAPKLTNELLVANKVAQAPLGLKVVRQAIRSQDWSEVSTWLEGRGEEYAQLGISIDIWMDLVLLTQKHTVASLLQVEQPVAVLQAMHTFWARAMRVARQRYVDEIAQLAKEDRLARRDSEKRFQRLTESGILGVTVTETTGRVLDANQNFLDLLGYSRAECDAGLIRWDELTPPEWAHVSDQIMDDLRAQGFSRPREKAYFHKDGTIVPVLVGVASLDPPQAISCVLDLTERKRLEEELRQSQKLEAIGSLTAGIAHDFNNMLSVILSCSDVVLDDLGKGHKSTADVEDIRDAAQRSAELVDQLLTYSRKQARRPHVTDLGLFVTKLKGLLQRLVGSEISISTSIRSEVSHVRVDRNQLQQILMNLAANARDAMPNGGALALALQEVELSATQRSSLNLPAGGYVELAVSDTGQGMDSKTQSRVFEPFFTTKGQSGTGFGLSTVYGIMRQSGGAVAVESARGRGATFRCYFPASDALANDEREEAAEGDPAGGTETILLLDDHEPVRKVARDVLLRGGYHVLVAKSASHALELAQEHGRSIALLLTDVVMPDMNGRELARAVEELHPSIRILLMTGYDERHSPEGVQEETRAFVRKPLTVRSLLSTVRRVLDC